MIEQAEKVYESGKKSLESLLREKAYSDVKEHIEDKGIDIDDVSDEDIESLVAAKAQDMMNGIKGFGVGTAFAIAVSLVTIASNPFEAKEAVAALKREVVTEIESGFREYKKEQQEEALNEKIKQLALKA